MPLTELFVARFADEQGVPRPKTVCRLSTVSLVTAGRVTFASLKYDIPALTQLEGYELRPQDPAA